MSLAPIDVIKSFENYIQCEVNMGLSSMVDVCSHTMGLVASRLRALSPTMEEVTVAMQYLHQDNGTFSLEQRQELSSIAKASMRTELARKVQRSGYIAQKHMHLEKYLTAKMWGVLSSSDIKKNKFQHLAHFLIDTLGMRYIDAQTRKVAVVIVHLASDLDPDPMTAYKDAQDFGVIMEQKRTSSISPPTMSEFPANPAEFIKIYPSAYAADDPPVASRIDKRLITERCRKDITPLRTSNSQIVKATSSVSRSPSSSSIIENSHAPQTSSDSVNNALLSILDKFMFQRSSSYSPPIANRSQHCNTTADGTGQSDSFVGGGVAPKCLETPATLDSIKNDLLGDTGSPLEDIVEVKKVKSHTESDDDVDADPAIEVKIKKRPAAKGKAAPTPKATPPKAPSGKVQKKKTSQAAIVEAREKEYAVLLKRPAKAPRPAFTIKKPIHHHGGRMYFAAAKKAYRVYRRKCDKVEKTIAVDPSDKADLKRKFIICCAMIENDPRPVDP